MVKINKYFLLSMLLVMVFTTACSTQASKTKEDEIQDEPITVETSQVIQGEVESTASFSSKIKPIQEIIITPKQPGKVLKVNFEIGERVKKGQVLFELDKSDAQLQLNQASAAVGLSEINLKKMSGTTYEQQMIQLKTALTSAEINYNDAKTNYDTVKTLYEAGGESRFNYERAESQLKLLSEQYEAAKANYELSEERTFAENIELAELQLKQAKATYDMAKSALDNMDVRSPIDGIVSTNNLKVGEFISNAAISYVLVDDSSYIIDIDLGESIIGNISLGDKARVYINAISEEALIGTVKALAPSADIQKQTYLVKIELDQFPDTLKGGMFAKVKLTSQRAENSLLVPLSSVLDKGDKTIVYTIQDDKAVEREVAVGIFDDNYIEIIDGIKIDDQVVSKGQDFLKDGSIIRIAE